MYQIDQDLNTKHPALVGGKRKLVPDYPLLNGELRTLKAMTMAYHRDAVAPRLWKYGLLK